MALRREYISAKEQIVGPRLSLSRFAINYPTALHEAGFLINPREYATGAVFGMRNSPVLRELATHPDRRLVNATTAFLAARFDVTVPIPGRKNDNPNSNEMEIATLIAPHLLQREPHIDTTTAPLNQQQIDRHRFLMDKIGQQAGKVYDEVMDRIPPETMDRIRTIEDLSRMFGLLDMRVFAQIAALRR